MKTSAIAGLLLLAIMVTGVAASIGYMAVGPRELTGVATAGTQWSFFDAVSWFAPFFLRRSFLDESILVSLSAPMKPGLSSASVIIKNDVGFITIRFTDDTANQYFIEGRRGRNTVPPTIDFTDSTLKIILPVGTYSITFPRFLQHSIQVSMGVGNLELDAAGANLAKLDAQVSVGRLNFNVELKGGAEVVASVSTGSVSGIVNMRGVALQLTGRSELGSVTVRGTGLVTVTDTFRFKQMRTINFDTATEKATVDLLVRTGSVDVRVV